MNLAKKTAFEDTLENKFTSKKKIQLSETVYEKLTFNNIDLSDFFQWFFSNAF